MTTKGLGPMVMMFLVIGLALTPMPTSLSAQSGLPYQLLVLDEPHQRVFAVELGGSSVQVLSLSDLQVIQTVPLGSPIRGLDLSPDGRELAVALPNVNQLTVVNLQNTAIMTQVVIPAGAYVPSVYDVLYGREGRLYVSDADSAHHLMVFDTHTKTLIAQSPWSSVPNGRLTLTADNHTLYAGYETGLQRFDVTTDAITVTAQQPNTLARILELCILGQDRVATSDGRILPADLSSVLVQLPQWGLHMACSASGDRVYLTNGSLVYAFDATSGEVLRTWDFHTSLGALQLNEAGDRLYVATGHGLAWLGTELAAPIYLPALYSPKLGLYGRVTLNTAPLAGAVLTLYRTDAQGQTNFGSVATASDGAYFFPHPLPLDAGQGYRVEYQNPNLDQDDRVFQWRTQEITHFSSYDSIDLGSFDVATVVSVSPATGASVRLPQTFQWTVRDMFPDETYEFVLYYPAMREPSLAVQLGHVDRYTLPSVPATILLNSPYDWTARIHSANGGTGIPYPSFEVRFIDRGPNAMFAVDPRDR